jgi:hypothetical protein
MKNKFSAALLGAIVAGLTGCAQMPTETQSVVDQRPQITFRIAGDARRIAGARVLVDELDMGQVHEYLDGKASLRILPGTHVIKVQSGGTVFLMERAYLSDGVVRPFVVNAN